MGNILDMASHKSRKLDCQNETVDLRPHLEASDTMERRISAAGALARCVRLMQEEFGDHYAIECLSNEMLRVKGRK